MTAFSIDGGTSVIWRYIGVAPNMDGNVSEADAASHSRFPNAVGPITMATAALTAAAGPAASTAAGAGIALNVDGANADNNFSFIIEQIRFFNTP